MDASEDETSLNGAFDASFLEVSMSETASESRLQCAICDKQFNRKDNLKRHSKIHLDTPQFHCTYCNQYFDSNERLQKYRSNKHETHNLCSSCGKTILTRTAVKKHTAIHHQVELGTPTKVVVHTCPYQDCGKKYTQKTKFIDHMNLHTGLKPYNYAHCQKTFSSRYKKNEHEDVCGREVSLSCKECSLPFSNKDSLKRHMAAKHLWSYSCECGKVFAYQSALCRHCKNKNH